MAIDGDLSQEQSGSDGIKKMKKGFMNFCRKADFATPSIAPPSWLPAWSLMKTSELSGGQPTRRDCKTIQYDLCGLEYVFLVNATVAAEKLGVTASEILFQQVWIYLHKGDSP